MKMAMNNACHQRPAPLARLKILRFSPVSFLSVFLATNTVAGDSTASKADVERGVRTPKIDFIGNRAFSSEKLMEVLLSRKGSWLTTRKGCWLTESGSLNPNALYEVTDDLTAFYYSNGFLDVQVDRPQIISIDRAMIGIDEGSCREPADDKRTTPCRSPSRSLRTQPRRGPPRTGRRREARP